MTKHPPRWLCERTRINCNCQGTCVFEPCFVKGVTVWPLDQPFYIKARGSLSRLHHTLRRGFLDCTLDMDLYAVVHCSKNDSRIDVTSRRDNTARQETGLWVFDPLQSATSPLCVRSWDRPVRGIDFDIRRPLNGARLAYTAGK